MDVEKAIATEIEPKLRDVFGLSTTRSLLTMATLTYVTNVGGKIQRFRAFVDSICSDERVIDKWGEAATAKQAKEWKDLAPRTRNRCDRDPSSLRLRFSSLK